MFGTLTVLYKLRKENKEEQMSTKGSCILLCVVCFVLGGVGLYLGIPHSGWAIFVAVVAGLGAT